MMSTLINFLVLMVPLLAGLSRTGSLPPCIGYGAAIILAAITFLLAIVRYRQRSK